MRPYVDRRGVFCSECVDAVVEGDSLFGAFFQAERVVRGLRDTVIVDRVGVAGVTAGRGGARGPARTSPTDERRIPDSSFVEPRNTPMDQLVPRRFPIRSLCVGETTGEGGRKGDEGLLFVTWQDGDPGECVDIYRVSMNDRLGVSKLI